jgi:hypothetical protein
MNPPSRLKRKSFFVDEGAIRRAKRILGVPTEAEVIRLAVERVSDMDRFWKLMDRTAGKVPRGSFDRS